MKFQRIPPDVAMVGNDPVSRLSPIQIHVVFPILAEWRYKLSRFVVHVGPRRANQKILNWSEWSNNDWVSLKISEHTRRVEAFARPTEVPITAMLHLALPPGWYNHITCPIEQEVLRMYGYWRTEAIWVPPLQVQGEDLWVKRNY